MAGGDCFYSNYVFRRKIKIKTPFLISAACFIPKVRGADECEKQMVTGVAVNLGLVFSMTPLVVAQARVGEEKDSACLSSKMVQLKGDMQKVWIDHTIWTRNYIVSAISNLSRSEGRIGPVSGHPGRRHCQTVPWKILSERYRRCKAD